MDIPKHAQGFTLIELLTALAVVAITIGFSIGFTHLISSQRLVSEMNSLIADMNYARSEAIKSGSEVVVCISSGGLACDRGSRWHRGWIVFHDLDGDRRRDADEPVKRRQNALQTTTIRYRGFPSRRFVRFLPNGFTDNNGTFSFCAPSPADFERAVILSKSGRLRKATRAGDGAAIAC